MTDKYIPAGLRADEFRTRLEDKNKLSSKGSLYAGTGNVEQINGKDCYETVATPTPTETGSVLTYSDSGETGLEWKGILDVVNGAGAVAKAVQAVYASEDHTKGTIEERLTNLGFKEGVVENLAATALTNFVKRQGNYVFGELTFADDVAIVNKNSYGVIPENFRPKQGISIYGSFVRMEKSNSAGLANEELYGPLKIYIDPSSGKISSTGIKADRYLYDITSRTWTQNKNYESLDWYNYSLYGLKIYFGYEASPLS